VLLVALPLVYLALRRTFPWREFGRIAVVTLLASFCSWLVGVRNLVVLHRFIRCRRCGHPMLVSTGGYPLSADEQAIGDAAAAKGKTPSCCGLPPNLAPAARGTTAAISARLGRAYAASRRRGWCRTTRSGRSRTPRAPRRSRLYGAIRIGRRPCCSRSWTLSPTTRAAAAGGVSRARDRPRRAEALAHRFGAGYFVVVHSLTLFINRYLPGYAAVILLAAARCVAVWQSKLRSASSTSATARVRGRREGRRSERAADVDRGPDAGLESARLSS